MLQISVSRAFLFFFIYSFIGWFCETIFCWIGNKKLVNRGFLTGPYCPIYGFGALLIITLAAPFKESPLLAVLITMVSCGILEYFTSWAMESIFQTRWWDYSKYKLQINGRVCLYNLVWFGIMGLFLIYLIHPIIESLLQRLTPFAEDLISTIIFVGIITDLIHTLSAITKLRDRLHKVQSVISTLEEYEEQYSWYDKHDIEGSVVRLRQLSSEDGDNEDVERILSKIDKAIEAKGSHGRRLMTAFPNAKFKGLEEAASNVRTRWNKKKEDIKEDVKLKR